MASYLESYGAIEERKARKLKLLKRIGIVLVCVIVAGSVFYILFRNYSEEQDAKTFLKHLRNREYQQAYGMFGCTAQTPCPNYSLAKFMEDWGPGSPHPDSANAKVSSAESCGNGVLLRIDYPKGEPVMLMVDRSTDVVSFAPPDWSECPGRKLRFWQFLKNLFHKQ